MARRMGLSAVLFLWCSSSILRAEWAVAGYAGATFTQDSYLKIRQPALLTNLRFTGVGYRGDSFDSPLYYGFRSGYYFNSHMGIEGEFIHLKVYAKVDRPTAVDGTLDGEPINAVVPMDTIVQRFDISHGVNLLLGNFIYRWSFFREPGRQPGRLVLAGRFGLGGTIPHPESTVLEMTNEHYQLGRWALQAAGGAEVRLWRGLYGLGEYKFTRTPQRVRIYEGHAETLLKTHHIIFGLAYHF